MSQALFEVRVRFVEQGEQVCLHLLVQCEEQWMAGSLARLHLEQAGIFNIHVLSVRQEQPEYEEVGS